MGIDLSRFKVVHGDKVFNAIALMEVHMPENVEWDKRDIVLKPKFIDVLAINEDGNIISIYDDCLLYTSPSPRDRSLSRMPSSA